MLSSQKNQTKSMGHFFGLVERGAPRRYPGSSDGLVAAICTFTRTESLYFTAPAKSRTNCSSSTWRAQFHEALATSQK